MNSPFNISKILHQVQFHQNTEIIRKNRIFRVTNLLSNHAVSYILYKMALEGKCFSFTWKVDNMIGCPAKLDETIRSPPFVLDEIDETTWRLGFKPRGKNGYIGLYLCREDDDGADDFKEVKCEFALIGKDGSVLVSKTGEYAVSKGKECGCATFATIEQVFNTKRSIFLPQDTLTVRCKISKTNEAMQREVQCFARTRMGIEHRSYLRYMDKFSSLEPNTKCNHLIKSHADNAPLISVDLLVTEEDDFDKIIHYEITPLDKTIKYCTLRLSLVDTSGHRIECNGEEFWFDQPRETKQFTFIFTKKIVLANKEIFLPKDTLSMHWEWTFSKGIVLEKIEETQYGSTSSPAKISEAIDGESVSLDDNVKSFYDEKFLCDIKLKTETGDFPAHKIVLANASPVFKTMFLKELNDKGSDCVVIENLDDDMVSQMLHFIYTSNVKDLTWEKAFKLYGAAKRYDIESLKKLCSNYMRDNLSSRNACEALLLAHNNADSEIKDVVKNYILGHAKEMMTSDWTLLMNSNGKLAAETLYRILRVPQES